MKKLSAFLLVFVLLGVAGCGPAGPAAQDDPFAFTYNGCQIALNADAAPVIAALGEPLNYTEEASCAFDGLDKTYGYGSFYLSTYPLDGNDHVYSIWFADDGVSTEEGIRLGDSQAEVESAYGTECFNGTNVYSLVKGESRLTILLTEGKVSSIQYEAIIE